MTPHHLLELRLIVSRDMIAHSVIASSQNRFRVCLERESDSSGKDNIGKTTFLVR